MDQKNDALYLRLDESAIVDSEEIKPVRRKNLRRKYSRRARVAGIQIPGPEAGRMCWQTGGRKETRVKYVGH